MIATLGVLLGYFIIFYPILFTTQPPIRLRDAKQDFSNCAVFYFPLSPILYLHLHQDLQEVHQQRGYQEWAWNQRSSLRLRKQGT